MKASGGNMADNKIFDMLVNEYVLMSTLTNSF